MIGFRDGVLVECTLFSHLFIRGLTTTVHLYIGLLPLVYSHWGLHSQGDRAVGGGAQIYS